jgi:hypothetical protein
MSLPPAVRRLHNDLVALRRARKEGENDHRDLRKDSRKLSTDIKELAKDRKTGDVHHTQLDRANKSLTTDIAAKTKALNVLDAEKQVVTDKLAADTFDHDAAMPGVQQDPALLAQLADVTQRRTDTETRFDTKIQTGRDTTAQLRTAIGQDRMEIAKDRKAITHDRAVIKHDHLEIKHDRQVNKKLRARALHHLRPAEFKMGLKSTNRVRHELGLSRVNHVIRPINLHTVQGCAQFLLNSKNVSFWSGLSTGSDRKNLERLARGEKAFVPATGGHVTPKLSMMQALVSMAKHGHIQINALTGGFHSTGSNHYSGTAVDLDTPNAGMITTIARRFGGFRNSETSHIHLDF